jgi:hypothetical protein
MEHAKLEKGEHKPVGHSPISAPRKGVRKKAEFAATREEGGKQVKIRETGLPLLREQ